jgi:hypothetical protein
MQTKPSLQGRVESVTPSELQSDGDVQQTTGFGLLQDARRIAAVNPAIRIKKGCAAERATVNEEAPNKAD